MTEEFDVLSAFQQIRQRLHDTRQPRNLGSIVEALQPTTLQLNHDGMTVPPLPTNLDWTAIRMTPDRYWTELDVSLDEDDDDDNDEELCDIMDCMAWAYMPEEIQKEIRSRFYNGVPAIHQILLTIPGEDPSVTAVTVEVRRDQHTVQLVLDNEVIAYHAMNNPLEDELSPIFFDYEYNKLGTFFLGAAQLLWGAIGYETFIVDSRYIRDEESTPWELDNAELSSCIFHRVKQMKQLSGNFGVFKKKVRNARRRRNLYQRKER